MTPQVYRARLDRRSHLMEIAGLEALVPAKLVNILRRIPRSVHSETHPADGAITGISFKRIQ